MTEQKLFNQSYLLDSAKSWQRIIDKVFHLFGTKLLGITSTDILLKKTLPNLLKGYELAVQHNLMKDEIHPQLLESLSKSNIEASINPMLETMDSVLSMCKTLSNPDKNAQDLSAKQLIENNLSAFEFKDDTRSLIEFDSNHDFNIHMQELFLNTTLWQLFSFAQDSIKNPEKKINIHFSKQNDTENAIHLKIISSDVQKNYTQFLNNTLTKTHEKFVPGIEFCRLALLHNGGNIIYEVKEAESIEFVIILPKTS
jgi:hypothetical protein